MFPTEYTLLTGGLILGCLHALDADHVATVSTLILRKKPLGSTLRLALRWSAGHSLTLLTLAAMVVLGFGFEAGRLSMMERVVGLSMMVLGIWILWKGRQESHRPLAGHGNRERHSAWALFGMGVLHGTAGWPVVLLMVPLALVTSPAGVLAYVVAFSLGMIATMSSYAALINSLTGWEEISHHIIKLRSLSAVITAGIGLRLLYS